MLNVKSDRGDVHVEIQGTFADIMGDFGCALSSVIQGMLEGKTNEEQEFIMKSVQTVYMIAVIRAKKSANEEK